MIEYTQSIGYNLVCRALPLAAEHNHHLNTLNNTYQLTLSIDVKINVNIKINKYYQALYIINHTISNHSMSVVAYK